jgi:TetR/AcrR family transcriptional repressor of mexJK operon
LILDAATELFLAAGFGATSIEAVALRVRISKRTFYHRFANKEALFAAVVHRIIERLRPPAGVPLTEGTDLRSVLEHLAALILRAALSPQAIALHRLIVAESGRFPALAGMLSREGSTEEAVTLIAGVLERERTAGRIELADPAFAARQFLQMTIAVPQRRALGLGPPLGKKELAEWPAKVTDLFLNGCRPVGRGR